MIATVYHGTDSNIKRFEVGKSFDRPFTYNNGGAIYFTSDPEVARHYSVESFARKNEALFSENNIDDLLYDTAYAQSHIYEVELSPKNPIEIPINLIINKSFEKYRGIKKVLDAELICALVQFLTNYRYVDLQEYNFSHRLDDVYMLCSDLQLLEYYDEESDEYIEKNEHYDCIIIRDCIDSIDEDTNYMPSDIYVVLDENIINIKKKIRG